MELNIIKTNMHNPFLSKADRELLRELQNRSAKADKTLIRIESGIFVQNILLLALLAGIIYFTFKLIRHV